MYKVFFKFLQVLYKNKNMGPYIILIVAQKALILNIDFRAAIKNKYVTPTSLTKKQIEKKLKKIYKNF